MMLSYIKRHYKGELSLEVSYWINTVIVSVIFGLISLVGIDSIDITYHTKFWMVFIALYFLFIYFVVSPWMYIGLWRSADNYIEKYGVRFWANVVKILIIVGLFRTVFDFYGVEFPVIKEFFKVVIEQDNIPTYQIKVYNDSEIEILGGINFGLSKDFQEYLKRYPNIKTVRINSVGGRIVEATKIAKIIREKELDTYAFGNCFSACTYIFVAGEKRTLEYGTVLGFHQPILEGIDKEYLQEKIDNDKRVFFDSQIDRSFVKKVFETPNSSLWRPSYKELKEANVITDMAIANGDRFVNMSIEELRNYLHYYPNFVPFLDMKPQKIVDTIVASINNSLPRLVDKITRQDSVEVKNLKIVYSYTILEKIKSKDSFEKNMQKNLTNQICGDAFSIYLQKSGLSFEYRYNDINGSNIITVLIDSCDNNSLNNNKRIDR